MEIILEKVEEGREEELDLGEVGIFPVCFCRNDDHCCFHLLIRICCVIMIVYLYLSMYHCVFVFVSV